jgi:ACS family tartrate transporter-like MFS transporter
LPAVLLGVIVLFYLTDRPELASWLTQSERNYIVDELARERRIHGDTHFAKCESKQFASIWNALTNPIILKLGIIFFLAAIGFLGYSLWAPLVIQSLTGASDLGVGMILGGISAATIVFMLLNGRHSDRADERWIHTAVPLLIMGVGFLGCALLKMPLLAIIFLALVPIGHCSAYGPFWSIPSKFLSGPAAAAGTAMVVTIANVGGFLGPTMIGWLKKHTGTHSAAFLILGAFGVLAAAVAFAGRSQTANGHE